MQTSKSRVTRIEYNNYQDDWYNVDDYHSNYNGKTRIKSHKIKPAKFKKLKLHPRK